MCHYSSILRRKSLQEQLSWGYLLGTCQYGSRSIFSPTLLWPYWIHCCLFKPLTVLLPQDICICCSLCPEIPSPNIYMAAHPVPLGLYSNIISYTPSARILYSTGTPLSTTTHPSLHTCFSFSHSTCHLIYCIFTSLLIYCPLSLPKCKWYEGRDTALFIAVTSASRTVSDR